MSEEKLVYDPVDVETFLEDLDRPKSSDLKDAIFHKFIGDARHPFEYPGDHILCLADQGVTTFEASHVTTRDTDVSCEECLDLLKTPQHDVCDNCGKSIRIAIFKGTGHCSENCRKKLAGE